MLTMEFKIQLVKMAILIGALASIDAWKCKSINCIIHPLKLRLWRNHIEVSSRTLTVKAGTPFSITCDGSCVGSSADPQLRWYGPDEHWIAYQGNENRVHVDQSFSRRFLKLQITNVRPADQGEYTCLGWLGDGPGWNKISIRLVVEQNEVPPASPQTPPSLLSTAPSSRGTSSTRVTVESSTDTNSTTSYMYNATITASPTEQVCNPPRFQCGSGECLVRRQVCDSIPDCDDSSDERNCGSISCTEDMIACTDGSGCVTSSQICDYVIQCNDGSDEDPSVCNYN